MQNTSSLPLPETFTGNVTFYPRMDVLIMDPAALTELTQSQRDVLFTAARSTTQHVIDSNAADPAGAEAYCAAGGRVALASQAQVASFEAATKPVADALNTDPFTKTAVDRIKELKASLPPPDAVAPCGSQVHTATSAGASLEVPALCLFSFDGFE